MRKILIGFLFLFSVSIFSQDLKYGVVVGANSYDLEIKGPIIAASGISLFNIGGFADYRIKDRLGVKTHLIYNTTTEYDYYYYNPPTDMRGLFDSAKLKTLQLHSFLKYDVKRDYNKGFYLLGGLRMTNVLEAKSDTDENLNGFYKKVNFGGLFGFGTTFLKNFSFELVGDFSLTKTINMDDSKPKNLGCYANILFNIEPLFNHSN
ncbi:outer membrane beta-barrel protein [Flavobacterium flavipallidum]|uniref:Outer membrane beta-barrel protein n=1 Tax=Flavobacterium flavipallidum TaxID=3139140 RepID=A0ABU9HM79_9FLAO